jgi:beta-1,4-mannosyl-glycoprotein beta-1,4-N-acetylglucosaminyltransferase
MVKIVDCFLIYNELDLLDFKLKYLSPVVDYFVIVESTLTHSGNPKPMLFTDAMATGRYDAFRDKIVHVVVNDDIPPPPKPLIRSLRGIVRTDRIAECITRGDYQRNSAIRGVRTLNLDANDIIIISDADEIADRNTLRAIKETGIDKIYSLDQDLYYYNLSCKYAHKWHLSKCLNYKTLADNDYMLSGIRNTVGLPIMQRGGWHFSYFGNVSYMLDKIKQSADQRLVVPTIADIETRVKSNSDLFGRQYEPFIKIDLKNNNYLPEGYEYIIDNPPNPVTI